MFNSSESFNETIKEVDGLKIGDHLKVLRTDGRMETCWHIEEFVEDDGKWEAKVRRNESEQGYLNPHKKPFKYVPLELLKQWQKK